MKSNNKNKNKNKNVDINKRKKFLDGVAMATAFVGVTGIGIQNLSDVKEASALFKPPVAAKPPMSKPPTFVNSSGISRPITAPGIKPGVSGIKPGVGGVKPGVGGVKPGVSGVKPGVGGVKPSVGAGKPGQVVTGGKPGHVQQMVDKFNGISGTGSGKPIGAPSKPITSTATGGGIKAPAKPVGAGASGVAGSSTSKPGASGVGTGSSTSKPGASGVGIGSSTSKPGASGVAGSSTSKPGAGVGTGPSTSKPGASGVGTGPSTSKPGASGIGSGSSTSSKPSGEGAVTGSGASSSKPTLITGTGSTSGKPGTSTVGTSTSEKPGTSTAGTSTSGKPGTETTGTTTGNLGGSGSGSGATSASLKKDTSVNNSRISSESIKTSSGGSKMQKALGIVGLVSTVAFLGTSIAGIVQGQQSMDMQAKLQADAVKAQQELVKQQELKEYEKLAAQLGGKYDPDKGVIHLPNGGQLNVTTGIVTNPDGSWVDQFGNLHMPDGSGMLDKDGNLVINGIGTVDKDGNLILNDGSGYYDSDGNFHSTGTIGSVQGKSSGVGFGGMYVDTNYGGDKILSQSYNYGSRAYDKSAFDKAETKAFSHSSVEKGTFTAKEFSAIENLILSGQLNEPLAKNMQKDGQLTADQLEVVLNLIGIYNKNGTI